MDEHASGPQPDGVAADPLTNERAETLLRKARVLNMRGDRAGAAKLLAEAAEVAPGSLPVLEAQGDDLLERQLLKEAKEVFSRALELAPRHPTIEGKYAETVLRLAEADLPPALRLSEIEEVAASKTGAILSVFVPGLGQIVLGERTLGLGMMAGWLVGWLWALSVPDGLLGLSGLVGLSRTAPQVNATVFIPLFMAAACHLWAISDASARAKRLQSRKIERPLPPVDKDFEI